MLLWFVILYLMVSVGIGLFAATPTATRRTANRTISASSATTAANRNTIG